MSHSDARAEARPSFTGLLLHREPTLGYSFFVPDDWHRLAVDGDDGRGVLYAPSIDDPFTSISVVARDLGVEARASDLPDLRAGFRRGLRQFPKPRIESVEAEAIGNLITIEGRHTYHEGAATRKRWVRLLYQGKLLVRVVAQAASVDEFAYWEPMFYQTIRTFRFGDWAADVGVVAEDWLVGPGS